MWNVHYKSKYREKFQRLPLGRFFQSNLKSSSHASRRQFAHCRLYRGKICMWATFMFYSIKRRERNYGAVIGRGMSEINSISIGLLNSRDKKLWQFFSLVVFHIEFRNWKNPLCMDVGNEWLCCSAAHTAVHHFSPVFQFPRWWNLIPHVVCSWEKHKAALIWHSSSSGSVKRVDLTLKFTYTRIFPCLLFTTCTEPWIMIER